MDEPSPTGGGCYFGDTVDHCATSQIRARPDYRLAGHNGVRLITKLSKSTERGEKSRRTLKKPKSFKDESDGCIDTWIEVMELHFEEENL